MGKLVISKQYKQTQPNAKKKYYTSTANQSVPRPPGLLIGPPDPCATYRVCRPPAPTIPPAPTPGPSSAPTHPLPARYSAKRSDPRASGGGRGPNGWHLELGVAGVAYGSGQSIRMSGPPPRSASHPPIRSRGPHLRSACHPSGTAGPQLRSASPARSLSQTENPKLIDLG